MTAHGQKPGVLSYGALMSALEKRDLIDKAEQVWEHMLKVGMKPNEYAYMTMITVIGKAEKYEDAVELFDQMQRDGMLSSVVTSNAMITTCACGSDGHGAIKWLQQMELLASNQILSLIRSHREIQKGDEVAWYADGDGIV